jgi:hypothetical protein
MGRYLDLIAASSSCEISEVSEVGVLNSLNSQLQPDPCADFHVALRALDARRPDRVEDHGRWRQAVADGETFLARWDERALGLGWTVDDLFGLNPLAPLLRYDAMGLLWLLRGRSVVALTSESAAIENPNGAICVYRRYNKPTVGPLG